MARTQALNAAYEVLSDPDRRQAYDDAPEEPEKSARPTRSATKPANLAQDVHLKIDDFLRGTTLKVHLNDPANPAGPETYELAVPPETAPGTRFRVARTVGGVVVVRVQAGADFRFKVRGSDLRCDLRISSQRASQGGLETVAGAAGVRLRLAIPRGVARGEIIILPGEGLPKPRGGRGNLLVRIQYRPEIHITRAR